MECDYSTVGTTVTSNRESTGNGRRVVVVNEGCVVFDMVLVLVIQLKAPGPNSVVHVHNNVQYKCVEFDLVLVLL